MRIIFLFTFLVCSKIISAACFNSTQVSGRVLDNAQKPIEFAVVTLLNASDSSLVKGAETNAEGIYQLNDFPDGNYLLNVNFSGYANKLIGPFTIIEGENKKLEDILLDPSKEMEAVTIAAVQPLFSHKPGMLIMNVENSPVQISGTAYDVVRKAPGVTVDQDGNFSLLGKAGVKIYIDNKPTYLSGDQLKVLLQGMPGTQIVRVEIMSNPPAKYDAAGSAGIINIVTKQGTQQGFNGTVSAGFGYGVTPKEEASLSLNYGKPKSNIYFRYDFGAPTRGEYKLMKRDVIYNGGTTHFDQSVDLVFKPLTNHVRIGADFYPAKKISWGVRADGMLINSHSTIDGKNRITDMDADSSTTLHQGNLLLGSFNNGSAGVYYVQKLDTTGTELSASVDYVVYDNSADEFYYLHFLDDNGNEVAPPSFERADKSVAIGIYVAQVDFTHPFSKKYSFEAGIKSSFVKTDNKILFEIQDNSSGSWNSDPGKTNSFLYSEVISAAYISCAADYGKWQLKGGLRAEQTNSFGESPTTGTDHRNNYLQLFPTLFVSEKINEKHAIDYSFSRRINRPGYDDLNPFIFYIDQYTYRLGNPYLQPEISNAVDVTHSFADMLFTSIGLSRTTNGFGQLLRQTDSTGIVNQSTVNLNTIDNVYVSVTLSNSLTKWWINEANVMLNYNRFENKDASVAFNRSGTTFNCSLKETFLLAHGWKLEASGWYQSPMVYSLFYIQQSGDISLSCSKNFMKEKLRLSLSVSDVFYTQSQTVLVEFENQDLYSLHDFDSRVVYARARYNFGNSAAARKSNFKSGADDLKKRA